VDTFVTQIGNAYNTNWMLLKTRIKAEARKREEHKRLLGTSMK